MSKITVYSPCDTITFDRSHKVIVNSLAPFTFFGSYSKSLERLQQAWIPSSIEKTIMSEPRKKSFLNNFTILNNKEMLGNIFVLSIINRIFSVISSNIRLKMDLKGYHPLASFAVSIIPAGLMLALFGTGFADLILINSFAQMAGSLLSQFSIATGNFLRRLDLISETRKFNLAKYLGIISTGLALDFIISFVWRGAEVINKGVGSDTDNKIFYCFNEHNKSDATFLVENYKPLIAFSEKLVWYAARVVFDVGILLLNSFGHKLVKDLRSPLFNVFPPSKAPKIEREVTFDRKKDQELQPRSAASASPISDVVLSDESFEQTPAAPARVGRVKKGKRGADFVEEEEEVSIQPVARAEESPARVDIGGTTFYKLNQGHNLYGAIGPRCNVQKEIAPQMTNALQRSDVAHVAGTKRVWELRGSHGARGLGLREDSEQGITRTFHLGKALVVTEQLKQQVVGDKAQTVVFTKIVRHDRVGTEARTMDRG